MTDNDNQNQPNELIVVHPTGQSSQPQLDQTAVNAFADIIAKKIAVLQNPHKPIVFEAFAKIFMSNHASKMKTHRTYKTRLRMYLLPAFGGKLLTAITVEEITAMHRTLLNKPYQANRVLEQLSTMFKKAQDWGYYPENCRRPTAKVESYREMPRDRFVTHAEVDRLVAVVNSRVRSLHIWALVWLYLLLGLRKTELLRIKWDDINWEIRQLKIGQTKNGRPHHIPLSLEALTILNALPRGSSYVFPGKVKGTHLTHFDRSWQRIRRDAQLNGVRLHDLRRSTGSWMAQSGVPLGVIGKVLNHRSSKSTEIYAHFTQDDVKQALNEHAEALNKHIGIDTTLFKLKSEQEFQPEAEVFVPPPMQDVVKGYTRADGTEVKGYIRKTPVTTVVNSHTRAGVEVQSYVRSQKKQPELIQMQDDPPPETASVKIMQDSIKDRQHEVIKMRSRGNQVPLETHQKNRVPINYVIKFDGPAGFILFYPDDKLWLTGQGFCDEINYDLGSEKCPVDPKSLRAVALISCYTFEGDTQLDHVFEHYCYIPAGPDAMSDLLHELERGMRQHRRMVKHDPELDFCLCSKCHTPVLEPIDTWAYVCDESALQKAS